MSSPDTDNATFKPLTIRPSFIPHLLAVAIAWTFGSVLAKAGYTDVGLASGLAGLLIGLAAFFDRFEFDGRILGRTGPLSLLPRLLGRPQQIAVSDVETVATDAASIGFSSGDARLTYRTRIAGGNAEIVVRSNRASYVPFIKALFHAVGADKLDPRSHEIHEYFEGRKAVTSVPVLRGEMAVLPVSALRRFANSLRLAGRLRQAADYFRIAYEKEPRNPELLYEMSRYYRLSAQTDDVRMIYRSDACLRLASKLAGATPALLERIGEGFFERLDYKRAASCFQRALTIEPGRFRANVGLAEIALRDGKLAHVAHFYHAASASGDAALARLARREADYYERLVSDDDFLESELRRIRLANLLHWTRRLAALVFLASWLTTSIGGRFNPVVEDFGLAMMVTSGALWVVAVLASRLLRRRS